MMSQSPFRTLFAVYFVALLAAVCEFFSGSSRQQREPDIYGDPVRNLPDAILRLYPGSPDAEYLLGRRYEAAASRRIQQDSRLSLSQAMIELNAGYREAIRHYERAIELGLRSDEGLIYNYALALIRTRADPARIDRAIADWHRNFPFSTRDDLNERRQAIEQKLRQLPSANQVPDGTAVARTSVSVCQKRAEQKPTVTP